MNFFKRQDRARRKTKRLIVFFALAVIGIIGSVYLALMTAFFLMQSRASSPYPSYAYQPPFAWWDPNFFSTVLICVLAVIVFGTLFKLHQIGQGGRAVAELLGGQPVSADTRDPDLKRLLNIVEEMAIASGTAVPPVYLLSDERGVNAFAAGFSTRDTVIGVTLGAVRLLSRDELQGVIAHEFSHILNGDMRLNLRLMGILYGILILALIGHTVLRSMAFTPRSRSRDGRAVAALMLMGCALLLIGYIGLFFGNLIKSAVSREREYLADASAVQFTRYPEGLAGALKKIGGLAGGSFLEHPKAAEASHLYFAGGLKMSFGNLFATHPPLDDRIRKLDPSFKGKYPRVLWPREAPKKIKYDRGAKAKPFHPLRGPVVQAGMAEKMVALAGLPDTGHLAYAAGVLEQIPDAVRACARDPFGARAVVYALLLDKKKEEVRKRQMDHLYSHGDYRVRARLKQVAMEVSAMDTRFRLPLVDSCMPQLAALSRRQYRMFKENIEELIAADRCLDYFELSLKMVLFHHLDAYHGVTEIQTGKGGKDWRRSALLFLAALAYVGHDDPSQAGQAFKQAAEILSKKADLPERPGGEDVERAMLRLRKRSFKDKEKIIRAAVKAIRYDGEIKPQEIEMIRAFADVLDCPLPPLTA